MVVSDVSVYLMEHMVMSHYIYINCPGIVNGSQFTSSADGAV